MADDKTSNKDASATSASASSSERKSRTRGIPQDGAALKGDLNQLWKSTVNQFDEMKDILLRSGSAGKAKLEVTLLKRQQDKLFVELGELLYRAHVQAKENGTPVHWPEGISTDDVLGRLDTLHEEIAAQQSEFDRLKQTPRRRSSRRRDSRCRSGPRPRGGRRQRRARHLIARFAARCIPPQF